MDGDLRLSAQERKTCLMIDLQVLRPDGAAERPACPRKAGLDLGEHPHGVERAKCHHDQRDGKRDREKYE